MRAEAENKDGSVCMRIEEVLDQIIELCRKHSASRVILFGSRARGTAGERSDIDIAVSGAVDFDGLAEEIGRLPTLYTIDLVNLQECGSDLLLEDIRQYGRKIYEKV